MDMVWDSNIPCKVFQCQRSLKFVLHPIHNLEPRFALQNHLDRILSLQNFKEVNRVSVLYFPCSFPWFSSEMGLNVPPGGIFLLFGLLSFPVEGMLIHFRGKPTQAWIHLFHFLSNHLFPSRFNKVVFP